jgi:hypothetical protein
VHGMAWHGMWAISLHLRGMQGFTWPVGSQMGIRSCVRHARSCICMAWHGMACGQIPLECGQSHGTWEALLAAYCLDARLAGFSRVLLQLQPGDSPAL